MGILSVYLGYEPFPFLYWTRELFKMIADKNNVLGGLTHPVDSV